MTFTEALKNENFGDLVDRMTAYAEMRISGVTTKQRNGVQPIDFVAEILRKATDGTRKWNSEKATLRAFLFGSLKSDIDNFLRKVKEVNLTDPLKDHFSDSIFDSSEARADTIQKLKKKGSNEEEVEVFCCWADGLTKPAEVADELKINVKDVNRISIRLARRLPKIQ